MPDKYQVLLELRKTEYKTWTPVFSPALRGYVVFNMHGFNHLRFKIDNTPRSPKEGMYKMGLLPLVRSVITHSTKVERYEKRLSPVGGSRKKHFKEMEYWALTCIVGKRQTKVRVILRRIGNSDVIHFWSVMKLAESKKSL